MLNTPFGINGLKGMIPGNKLAMGIQSEIVRALRADEFGSGRFMGAPPPKHTFFFKLFFLIFFLTKKNLRMILRKKKT